MLFQQFLLEKQYNEGIKETTLISYRFYFSLLPLSGMSPDDTTTLTVRNFRTLLASEGYNRKWSPATYNTARKCFNSYCTYLVRDKLLESNPFDTITKMREPQKLPKSLSVDQVKTLKYAITHLFNPNTFLGLRDICIFQTMLYTGIRRKELLDLKPSDLDLATLTIAIRNGKGGKGRIVPVCNQLIPVLSEYLRILHAEHSDPLFLFPSKNNFNLGIRNLRNVFEKVKEKIDFPLSPHRLRHTFATELVRNDLDIFNIASVLGHASVKTTQIYLTANTETINKKISSLNLYAF
ncbi:MAG: tyrosine-type recombinase/integrase [Candidatus Gracilibacteria bacterium]|nr:tyrosine-type recombinase/integrase [Candidatus Gracilibacteria bacterium]